MNNRIDGDTPLVPPVSAVHRVVDKQEQDTVSHAENGGNPREESPSHVERVTAINSNFSLEKITPDEAIHLLDRHGAFLSREDFQGAEVVKEMLKRAALTEVGDKRRPKDLAQAGHLMAVIAPEGGMSVAQREYGSTQQRALIDDARALESTITTQQSVRG